MHHSTPIRHRTSRSLAALAGRLACPAAIAIAAAGAWGQCTPDTILSAGTGYLVGDNPQDVAGGDVNGDGIADIVTANFFGGSVSVLIGNGDGTFQGATELFLIPPESELGAGAVDVEIGDLNGDGRGDIVVGVGSPDLGNPAVAVFLGDVVNGGFTAPEFYGFSTQIRGVRIANMNGDAFPDVVYANRDDDSLNVLPGVGDGTFDLESFTVFPDGPIGTVLADFNNDGVLEVATATTFTHEVIVTVNDGAGNLTELARYPVPAADGMAGGDLNGDGRVDLVVSDVNSNAVHFLLGNPDGSFQAAQTVSTGANSLPLGMNVADLNSDGFDDIVSGRYIASAVGVLLSNGDGTFNSSIDIPAGSGPRSVAFADFNGDGAVDVVVGTAGNDSASVLLNQCGGSTPVCACELDGNAAQVDVFDLLSYLDLWFANDAAAELTGDEPASVDVFDLLAFLDCWFPASGGAPCP
jgi:hypothetical protein